jgi:hypothetical protein
VVGLGGAEAAATPAQDLPHELQLVVHLRRVIGVSTAIDKRSCA